MRVVELTGVTKTYPGDVHALRGVTLGIEQGESVAIVGRSGSGKSTLMHIIGTLDRATTGSATVCGYDTQTLSDRELSALRARHIGFVFQHFHLSQGRSAVENVSDGLLYRGVPRRERTERARAALERVGLGHRIDHHPAQLSGGERQRVAIARAVVGNPTLILADEPTGALDSQASATVMALLQELNRDGATVCVITHDMEVADALRRQLTVRDGRVVTAS